jgi:3-hydroxy-9,10-secoandrosta-1,3,5(10)-triene-9,17-dione monooxygenase reductase component
VLYDTHRHRFARSERAVSTKQELGAALRVDARQFRDALGSFTTGVTIVTTRDAAGQDIGLTVNSFNSVSLEPPLVLWSLAKTAASLKAFVAAQYFAVHILAADQEQISNLFARRGADKFGGLNPARGHGDVPLLDGCSARFECRSAFQYDGGDHAIFVGEVVTFDHFNRPPLAFQGGKYALAMKKIEAAPQQVAAAAEEDDYGVARNALNVLLGMAYHQLNLRLKPELERHGLLEDEYWVINVVGSGRRTLGRVAQIIAFTGKRVSPELVTGLQQRGFVSLGGEGEDAAVSLTERGRQTLIELAAITKAIEEDAEGGLDYAEAQLFKQLLTRIIRNAVKLARTS